MKVIAMAGNWRYVRGNQSVGPLGLEEMRELVDRGELQPEDRVWTDGMPDWEPAGRRTELFPSDADAAPAQARSVVSAVSYFAPFGGQLPDRAAANLRGHAAPTGDSSEWPLDDRLVGVFHDAMNPRRKISTAAALYFVLSVFWVIVASVVLIAIAARLTPGSAAPLWAAFAVLVAFAALHFAAARAVRRAALWAPLVLLTLNMLGVGVSALGVWAAATDTDPDAKPALVMLVGTGLYCGTFVVISWRAFAAIPAWRSQPAWCQELIVKAGL